MADVNGDGTNDVLVVNASGAILYRQGIPGQSGSFEPPVTVNPGDPSRDIAWVPDTADGPILASVDAQDDAVSLYAYRDGAFQRIGILETGQLPAQILAADLSGDGQFDLVVRNVGGDTLSVYRNTGEDPGSGPSFVGPKNPNADLFEQVASIPVALGASDVQAVDTSGDGLLDLVVTNELTGEVSVLYNEGDDHFAAPVSYRAGTGLTEIDPGGTQEVSSLDVTAGVAGGLLGPGGPIGLVTINPGTNTIDVLKVLGDAQLSNPVSATPVPIPDQSPPQFLRMAEFTAGGNLDLAVLTLTGLSIYLGNGQGGFAFNQTYPVPSTADGLTVADLSGNGRFDVVVGDAYGDVLVLMGNGDGTFQPYRTADQSVLLAVADLTGNGSKDFIFADQSLDQVSVQFGGTLSPSVVAPRSQDLIQPGAVTLADLNGDGIPDLIVADSGGNNVLIYPGEGNGQFGPAIDNGYGYFVGTNPVGITVADLTGGLPDLVVADEGSNQVSILLNTSQTGGPISFQLGQRLSSGGSGPVATVVGTFSGNVYPDIMVTNSGSNDVTMLKGVQPGFFTDLNPRYYPVGTAPENSFVANFDGQTRPGDSQRRVQRPDRDLGLRGRQSRREHALVRGGGPDDGLHVQHGRRILGPGRRQQRRRGAGTVRGRPARAGNGLSAGSAGPARPDVPSILDPDRRRGGLLRGDGGAGVGRPGGPEPVDPGRDVGERIGDVAVLGATGGVERFRAAAGGDGADVHARGLGRRNRGRCVGGGGLGDRRVGGRAGDFRGTGPVLVGALGWIGDGPDGGIKRARRDRGGRPGRPDALGAVRPGSG